MRAAAFDSRFGVQLPFANDQRVIVGLNVIFQPSPFRVGLAAEKFAAVGPHVGEEKIEQRRLAAAVAKPKGGVGGLLVGVAEVQRNVIQPGVGMADGDKANSR